MKTKIETITPARARELLQLNTQNRPVAQNHVNYLASEMVNGRFQFTHQGICIGSDGVLMDGQHRLLAVVQSGCSVEMMVTTGAPKDIMAVIDTCARTRSVGDQLHLNDGTTEAALKVGAVRAIVSMCCYYQTPKVSVGSARALIATFGREIDFVIAHIKGFKPARRSWIVGALALAMSADRKTAEFITAFGSGENLSAGDPAKAARDWLANGRNSKITATYKRFAMESILNAAYNAISGNKLTHIRSGLRGVEYFTDRKRKFVSETRAEYAQQLVDSRTLAA